MFCHHVCSFLLIYNHITFFQFRRKNDFSHQFSQRSVNRFYFDHFFYFMSRFFFQISTFFTRSKQQLFLLLCSQVSKKQALHINKYPKNSIYSHLTHAPGDQQNLAYFLHHAASLLKQSVACCIFFQTINTNLSFSAFHIIRRLIKIFQFSNFDIIS